MFRNILIGNILNIISIYIFFIITLVVFYDSSMLQLFKKALINMLWFSPIILIVLIILGIYDFIYCQEKNKKWLWKETIISILIALIFFLFEGQKKDLFIRVYLATLYMSVIFIVIQYIKYRIFLSCRSKRDKI